MPTVHRFPGFEIRMFYGDHNPPHYHLTGRGFTALVSIADGEVLRGNAPAKALRQAREWAARNRAGLVDIWNRYK
jgi:hypothetical protein